MFESILIEERRDAGSRQTIYFAIPSGRESAAGSELLTCLADGAEVSLRNDLDEGGEGFSSFCRSSSGNFTRVGGHGWQNEWKPIDEAAFLTAVVEMACHNRGGAPAQGSITQDTRLAIGPFDPPDDYAFEPEFAAPIPRPIPPRVR